MLGIGKAIPEVIKRTYFSSAEQIEVKPAVVTAKWRGHPVKIDTQLLKREDVNIRRQAIIKRVQVPHTGLVNVTVTDESRPFEFRPSAEAVAGGALEVVMKRNGNVPINEIDLFIEHHELDTYAMALSNAFAVKRADETGKMHREAAQILVALVDGDYEPFYFRYLELIKRPTASPSWASRPRYQGNVYDRSQLIDPPDMYIP